MKPEAVDAGLSSLVVVVVVVLLLLVLVAGFLCIVLEARRLR